MTKRTALILFFIAVGIVLLSGFAAIMLTRNENVSQNTQHTSMVSAIENTPYLLKEYQGKIALYTSSNSKPEEVYEIYLNILPEYDQKRLKEGIPVSDQAQLKTYLEEFDS
ncbi:MAG: hypothetical protein ACOX60_01825 [Massiliimalia sp.]|jgi:hypothetical protein